MGFLVDQFCQATKEWAGVSGYPVSFVTGHVLMITGGIWYLPHHRRDFTIEEMKGFLEEVTDVLRMDEVFLIVSVVRAIEDELKKYAYGYEESKRRNQQRAAELQGILADPERRNEYIAALEEKRQKLRTRGRIRLDEPMTEKSVQNVIELLERMPPQPNFSERVNRDIDLESWRGVTAPLLAQENLERVKNELYKRWGVFS